MLMRVDDYFRHAMMLLLRCFIDAIDIQPAAAIAIFHAFAMPFIFAVVLLP